MYISQLDISFLKNINNINKINLVLDKYRNVIIINTFNANIQEIIKNLNMIQNDFAIILFGDKKSNLKFYLEIKNFFLRLNILVILHVNIINANYEKINNIISVLINKFKFNVFKLINYSNSKMIKKFIFEYTIDQDHTILNDLNDTKILRGLLYNEDTSIYFIKYLKYKNKYFKLKNKLNLKK